MLTSIGQEVQAVAVGWELYERTRSERILGLTGLVQFLPVLLFALPAGQAADRFSRKGIYQLGQVVNAVASVALAALSLAEGPVELMLGCLFVAGVVRAFGAPARQSLVPQLVPPATLANAIAWNATGWQIANITGPALGGLVLAVTRSPAAAYGFAASAAIVCAVLLAPVRPILQPRAPLARSLATLLAGVRFVFRTKM